MRRGRKFLDLKGMVGIIGAFADVAELADAQASGACGGNPVEVRLLSSAFSNLQKYSWGLFFYFTGFELAVNRAIL